MRKRTDILGVLGCAAIGGVILVVVAAAIGAVAAWIGGGSVTVGLLTGGCVGSITALAALLLSLSDHRLSKAAWQKTRARLLARADVDDELFCQELREFDAGLVLDVRKGVAEFFDVPPGKIHPRDELDRDYSTHASPPLLIAASLDYFFVAERVLAEPCDLKQADLLFPEAPKTLHDLVRRIHELKQDPPPPMSFDDRPQ